MEPLTRARVRDVVLEETGANSEDAAAVVKRLFGPTTTSFDVTGDGAIVGALTAALRDYGDTQPVFVEDADGKCVRLATLRPGTDSEWSGAVVLSARSEVPF